MKKSLKLFTLAFALMFAITVKVNADITDVGTEDTLVAALNNGYSVRLTDNIENINSTIVIKGTGTINIDGNGKTISAESVKKVFEIYAEDGNLEVIFTNIKITNSHSEGRTIDTRTPNVTLTVKDSTLTTTGSGNNQNLNVGGPEGPVTINVTNSTIDAGTSGYGIITFNPVNLTIDNSEITGYAALYFKGVDGSEGSEGSKVTVKNSTLTGNSDHDGEQNNFATIALEDDGISLDIIDSTVEVTGSGDAKQVAFSQGSDLTVEKANTITISGESEVIVRPEGFIINQGDSKLSIEAGVSSNLEIPEEFLPEGVELEEDENGNYVVVEKTVEEPNPNTGDNVVTYILIGLISLVAFGYAANKLRKNA